MSSASCGLLLAYACSVWCFDTAGACQGQPQLFYVANMPLDVNAAGIQQTLKPSRKWVLHVSLYAYLPCMAAPMLSMACPAVRMAVPRLLMIATAILNADPCAGRNALLLSAWFVLTGKALMLCTVAFNKHSCGSCRDQAIWVSIELSSVSVLSVWSVWHVSQG